MPCRFGTSNNKRDVAKSLYINLAVLIGRTHAMPSKINQIIKLQQVSHWGHPFSTYAVRGGGGGGNLLISQGTPI